MKRIPVLAAVAALAAAPLAAQVVSPSEWFEPYARDVRGWDVVAIHDPGGFRNCRAHRGFGYFDKILLEATAEGLVVQVPVKQSHDARYEGAALVIDGQPTDRQVGIAHGYAAMTLGQGERQRIMSGSHLEIDIVNEGARGWSLHGSTAAILKAEECFFHSWQAPRPAAPPPQAQRIDGYSVGYAVHDGGTFRQRRDGSWIEEGHDGGFFTFRETGRDAENVYLDDASRDVQIAINVAQGIIWYAERRGPWRALYRVRASDLYRPD